MQSVGDPLLSKRLVSSLKKGTRGWNRVLRSNQSVVDGRFENKKRQQSIYV